jgi:hypothetical protein
MPKKLFIVGEETVFRVEIVGKGGDSIHDEFFKTEQAAVLATVFDGRNHSPTPVFALKLSDGRYIKCPRFFRLSAPPDKSKVTNIVKRGLNRVQRAILRV